MSWMFKSSQRFGAQLHYFHTYRADEIKGLLTANKQITRSNVCVTWTLSSQLSVWTLILKPTHLDDLRG
ncbi:hypothetical protein Q8A67_018634 [Cirrhinus molitorella]|uniref:Uncharacterized protein n=1 Tax=Cirrhinus molitorella TaxID=172907 RepID=A0AA88TEY1_9TELE|nr:hypothetical protein Q8A67_018634 [Cirrhinus molitorella]